MIDEEFIDMEKGPGGEYIPARIVRVRKKVNRKMGKKGHTKVDAIKDMVINVFQPVKAPMIVNPQMRRNPIDQFLDGLDSGIQVVERFIDLGYKLKKIQRRR